MRAVYSLKPHSKGAGYGLAGQHSKNYLLAAGVALHWIVCIGALLVCIPAVTQLPLSCRPDITLLPVSCHLSA